MKKPKRKVPRNPSVMPARQRKAGPHKDKRTKRAREDHRSDRYLDEDNQ